MHSRLGTLLLLLSALSNSVNALQKHSVDLENPIDIAKPIRRIGQASVVLKNNRKEARLPFQDPRQSLVSNLNSDQVRRVYNQDEFQVPSFKNSNADLYKPLSASVPQRSALQRRRETNLQINTALRKRNNILSTPLSLNSETAGNTNPGTQFSSWDNKGDKVIQAGFEISDSGNRQKLYHSSNRRPSNHEHRRHNYENRYPEPPRFSNRNHRKGKSDIKPPILIIEKVPVYHVVETPAQRQSPQGDEKHKYPDEGYSTLNSEDQLDRRPNRHFSDESSSLSHNEPYYHESVLNEHSPKYGDAHAFVSNVPYADHSVDDFPPPPTYIEGEDSHPANFGDPIADVFIPGNPLPYILQESVNEEDRLAFQHRAHSAAAAEALAIGALQQQALAGLAFNHRLNQIAIAQNLQRQASHLSASHGKNHQLSDNVRESTTNRDIELLNWDDTNHKDLSLKDTITNQIKRHFSDSNGADKERNREELIKHLLRLR